MELKYTSGPWAISEHLNEKENWIYAINGAKNGGDIICCPPDMESSLENWPTNAKLIIAAPDLLTTCLEVLECLANAPEREYERNLLQTAINKATK